MLHVVGLVFHTLTQTQYFGQGPGRAGSPGVLLKADVAVDCLQGPRVIAHPGAYQTEVIPGGRVLALRLNQLLEGPSRVRQLAGGCARQGTIPAFALGSSRARSRALEGVATPRRQRQARFLTEEIVQVLAQLFARMQSHADFQSRMSGEGTVKFQLGF